MTLILLPGCGTVVDLVKETFPQGKENKDYQKKTKLYLREINIYDQFNTVGLFDALWLSDEMRTVYADINAQMHGKTVKEKHAFLRRQLKENDHYISFYVLSTHDNPLSVKPIPWALYLVVDGQKYMPFEVKAVELVAEYKTIFGTMFNNHKSPYEVRFERNDANNVDILKEGVPHVMELYFSNPAYFSCATWEIDSMNNVVPKKSPVVVKQEKKEASFPRRRKKAS